MFQIGLAKADITPRAGIRMAGFGKRIQPCLGVNDPLFATVMVAADDHAAIAMIDCDLLMLFRDFTADLGAAVQSLTGIPAAHVMLSCTHTHYGPEVPSIDPGVAAGPRNYERAYRDWLVHQLAGLVFEANSQLQPAQMKIGRGACDIGVNRRERTADGEIILGNNPAGPIDRSVGVCRFETRGGQPLAAIVNFATHPVGQDVQVRRISADYVGATRRVFQETTGAPCLFWQGAAGNINILHAETDHANVLAAGTKLGREAARAWQGAQPAAPVPLRAISRSVEFPAYRCLSESHAAQEIVKAQRDMEKARNNPNTTPGLLAWHARGLEKLKKLHESWRNPALVPPPVTAYLQAFGIGELAWVCVPGELFNEIGSQIKNNSPYKNTFVVAYANDWIGYLPTAEAFDEGGYEVSQVCNLSPEGITMMVGELEAMVKEL